MLVRILALLAAAALSALVPLLLFDTGESAGAQEAAIPMPRDAVGLRMSFGIGDAEPTDWSGRLSATGASGASNSTWQAATSRPSTKKAGPLPIPPESVDATIRGPGPVEVSAGGQNFSFDSSDLALGQTAAFLDGKVSVQRLPATVSPAHGPRDEDYVAAAADSEGNVWAAYVEYELGAPINEAATNQGRFDSLVAKGNGDVIQLLRYSEGSWRAVGAVTDSVRDVWRPTVVATQGVVWIVWAEQIDDNWDLYARRYVARAGRFDATRRLTTAPGTDFNVVAAHDGAGGAWVAWQGWRDGQFDIFLQRLDDPGAQPVKVSSSPRNDWNPSIASGGDGAVWVAWDTYDKGSYDVFARRAANGRLDAPVAVAASAKFEARASVAVDAKGRAWVAYEDGPENWGKDYGDRWPGRNGAPFYLDRYIKVRVIEPNRVVETADYQAPFIETYDDDPRKPTDLRHRISIPRLALDAGGRAWLVYRRHTEKSGLGERWASYATYYDGARWSNEIPLPSSINLLDERPALVPFDGAILALYATDHRKTNVRDREQNDLFAAFLDAGKPADPPALSEVRPEGHTRAAMPIHPNEEADIARIRGQRVTLGGKTYRYVRGEFHRHTEISAHRDWDGPLEEVWRYGLDVAAMDWIGAGDHDYGYGLDYLWWLTQKQVDLYSHPGVFSPMYTYERSQGYPSGHRNVMFAQRGIRALPRLPSQQEQFGTEEGGSADIRNLYAYLKHFGGICSSHTSATNMGTDWRDSDPVAEPVVEIFQGHRLSAEEPNAPMAPRSEEEAIQGFRPAGFVWEAFKKDVRLGFQASSDHVSTHISYGMALVEDETPEALIDAFKRRHSYAAQDNVILDIRSGNHMMGDEFASSSQPQLEIRVLGATPIRKIDIVRQVEGESPAYVAAFEPGEADVQFSWTDRDARPGKVNMYYVRVQQTNEALAWASPLWIRYQP